MTKKKSKIKSEKFDAEKKRSAGILLHITSLPGNYGIGDLGYEARAFADFLYETKQSWWQMLPLNPTESGSGHSPYSSISSLAGNVLLISPDVLVKEKLLSKKILKQFILPSNAGVDFKTAEGYKLQMLNHAFENFQGENLTRWREPFEAFCNQEKKWLDDFALYVVLKAHHENEPWYQWPEQYRNKNIQALKKFTKENNQAVTKIKWFQYLFFKQWKDLKKYCNDRNVFMIGDLPFYVSHDSADVWSSPEIFSLDNKGRMKEVAGVPPDYFNDDGQLWGMPVFNWKVLKKQSYGWWINRIKKNCELFDLVRLDHFRAFADYWAVPASEKTARTGTWKKGPGESLFNALQKEIGNLPFIAEDLGDINDAVYALRDKFNFPGMKVLHFAFGDNMPSNDYMPHNYTPNFAVYTGTHDNNTTKGWFRKDASKIEQKHLQTMFKQNLSEKNIHLELIEFAFSSVAKIAIVPAQDLLGLTEKARMNAPASVSGNWFWRMRPDTITLKMESWLEKMTTLYNRS